MRVIAGSAKGRRLQAPAGMDTRPITDRIKESLFNILAPDIEGADFLDLFAGSGGVGIEALSRGARQAVFVDNSRKAAAVLAANLKHCDLEQHADLRLDDAIRAIKKLEREGRQFDIIYVDPPFTNAAIFSEVMAVLDRADILASMGKMVIRSHRKMDMPEKLTQLERYRLKEYGESVLHFYRKI
ncbi:MAG TPA: 16S rRNA (guanine(966)-N(2))-methyltransferase RsmD [Syntrophomonadaceae bacterium]|nr:16S rRNA (guanine(966)-N(2))-methyltransferase RsmD [Syntrophomonadaceae bacterium]